jgi:hypothetical protein
MRYVITGSIRPAKMLEFSKMPLRPSKIRKALKPVDMSAVCRPLTRRVGIDAERPETIER